jgi:hypothetical protein
MKTLLERKKVLEQLKQINKPIHREELEEHAKKYQDILDEKLRVK